MAKFIFRLQNILQIKLKLEEQMKIEFVAANSELRKEEGKLQVLIERREMYELRLKTAMEEELVLLEIKRFEEAIEVMKYQIHVQEITLRIAEQKMEQVRIKLNNVMRERKSYEILREKEFQRFREEIKEEERKEIDQLVTYSYRKTQEAEM